MKLTVVGCSGSMPGPDSAASCYLVEADGYRLLLDLGNGAFGPLQRYLNPTEVDAIVISHLHGDHFLDLVPMVVALRFHPQRVGRAVRLIAPAGILDRLTAASGEPGSHLSLADVFDLSEPGDVELGPFRLRFGVLNHSVPDYGVRIEHGDRSLVYSGDTAPCEELIELSRGANLALFEAGWPAGTDQSLGIHLTPRQAAQQAREAGAERLMLTHLVPWADRDETLAEASAAFGSGVSLASAGDIIDV
jgi:ribonuclease BN (tRNA processing enzyme)